ncbi:hypothetical protein K2X85_03490 [bacterium]|nr:hypothetical protein [bacterium]
MKSLILLVVSFGFWEADTSTEPPQARLRDQNIRRYDEWIDKVLFGSDEEKTLAITALRQFGPDALERFIERALPKQVAPIDVVRSGSPKLPPDIAGIIRTYEPATKDSAIWPIQRCIDEVAGQKDAWVSRLYWYTQNEGSLVLEQAESLHRPIVSLRLLGKLTDEYSCANSRFFRTLLYPDPKINQLLRDSAVLHWQSVRPVPRITIDFGDGRRLEQTVTGNSVHYVMDEHGRLVDAIPGLYAPDEFYQVMREALYLAERAASLDDVAFRELLLSVHSKRVTDSENRLRQGLVSIRNDSKLINLLLNAGLDANIDELSPLLPEDTWSLLARDKEVRFAPEAQARVNANALRAPKAPLAGRLALDKFGNERPMLRLMASLGETVAADTLLNELVLRRKLSQMIITAPTIRVGDAMFNDWNDKVYADVFLTPSTDPWLGLLGENRFAALPNGGEVSVVPPSKPED